MTAQVKPIPEGCNTLTPHLVVRDAAKAIEFYQQAFGAQLCGIHRTPDGKVMHAALRVGNSMLMLNDEFPNWNVFSPLSPGGGTSVTVHIYVEDVDAAFARAVTAGARVKMPVADMFWGDRYGVLIDPSGHQWSLATRTKELSEREIEEAGKAAFANMA